MSVCQWWEAVPALSGEKCSAVDGRLEHVAILILVPGSQQELGLAVTVTTPGPNVARGEVRDVT